jgi:5-formyltetrahydrofolate cyclo-ligase
MEELQPEFSNDKNALRTYFSNQAIKYGFAGTITQSVLENIISVIPKNVTVASFRSRHDEINMADLTQLRPDLKFVYPVVTGMEMHFRHPLHDKAFKLGKFKVEEPEISQSNKVELSAIDIILVPGIAFDRAGERLGRGQGHYDRVLTQFSGLKIGIGNVAQVANFDLPAEEHDIAMDIIITNQFILKVFSS